MTSIKECITNQLAKVVYGFYSSGVIKMHHDIHVAGIEETIDMLLHTDNSLVRFGDGEITIIRGLEITLQDSKNDLGERLAAILNKEDDKLKVALVDIFHGLNAFQEQSQKYWRGHLLFCRSIYDKYCRDGKYYSAFFSRCYLTLADKSRSSEWFEKIRHIWENKSIVIVEGAKSKNGVCDNLFSLANSVERIIGPSSNAYSKYDSILEECLKVDKSKLMLVSLGPAAKPLAQDLYTAGYRVIDIGNLDAEYSWFLAGCKTKEEAMNYNDRVTYEEEELDLYNSQIIATIS